MKLILRATLFDRVWQDGGTIVAVKRREAFLRYFQTAYEWLVAAKRSAVPKAGATGVGPGLYTPGDRDPALTFSRRPQSSPATASDPDELLDARRERPRHLEHEEVAPPLHPLDREPLMVAGEGLLGL